MIECKNCRRKYDYKERVCPECGTPMAPTAEEITIAKRGLDRALSAKNADEILIYRHFLADVGDTESLREYAKMLEKKNDPTPESIDTAMGYYKRAAEKLDPYSAYRYSRLVERTSNVAARFWLRFSAVLGSIDAYPETAELFSLEGEEHIASYYLSLAAACDDTDSIVSMARRYYDGVGVEANETYAKWYLDKLAIPPISAIKLAYRLRSVKAAEPPKPIFPEYDKYLRSLADEAKKCSFNTAYFGINEILYKRGNINAEVTLGILCTEGVGTERDFERAMRYFNFSMSRGNPVGAAYLGKQYLTGRALPKDPTLAMQYFERAAALGYVSAYEEMGDMYNTGDGIEMDLARAIEFYELAAKGGLETAAKKADELKTKRMGYFSEGYKIITRTGSVTESEAKSAFRSLAIATAMGESRAPRLLARCFAYGFGTEQDRPRAYFWFERAANGGDTEAYMPLALCYSRGFGTRFSYRDAVRYLRLATENGNEAAADELKRLFTRRMNKMVRSLYAQSMELIFMKKYEEAVRLLSSFESLAYPKALYTLGCLYEFGRGVGASDKITANKYYDEAAKGSSQYGSFTDPGSQYKIKILKLLR